MNKNQLHCKPDRSAKKLKCAKKKAVTESKKLIASRAQCTVLAKLAQERRKEGNLAHQQAERYVNAIHDRSENMLNLAAQQAERYVNAIRDKSEKMLNFAAKQAERDVNAICDKSEKTLNLAAQQAERDVNAIRDKSKKMLNLAAQQAERDVNAIRDKSEKTPNLAACKIAAAKTFSDNALAEAHTKLIAK